MNDDVIVTIHSFVMISRAAALSQELLVISSSISNFAGTVSWKAITHDCQRWNNNVQKERACSREREGGGENFFS